MTENCLFLIIKQRRSHPWKFLLSYENESERTTLLGDTRNQKEQSSREGDPSGKRITIGSYKGNIVTVKHILKKHVEINRSLKKQLQIRKELNHDNINRFIGACMEPPHIYILTQYCQRGSLEDILQNDDIHLDDMFVASLVSDLIKGMIFIHESEIVTHGNLKSSNCLVDSRWVLQIADFGFQQLKSDRSASLTDIQKHYKNIAWKAPELLRDMNRDPRGTQKGDVYSFALVLYDIIGRKGPWGVTGYSYKEIVDKVKSRTEHDVFRPELSFLSCEPFVKQCLMECWCEDPEQRPDFKFIRYRLKPLQAGLNSNILDNMIAMMEKYAHNLEGLVAERTEQLSEEKKMTENLLLRMLPRFVADQLKRGKPVAPETFDSVTCYFSDIVGFTALSADSTPFEIVCMLNDLYTYFDSIADNYDAYKVETIGDAYFVVSGLPIRNGDLHAGEIASMSLELLDAIRKFKIRHKPHETLKLRIGIHSGPCVAGVVGLRMPRYTLFGDTVNTASRMETTGVPLKIHCSAECRAILKKLGGYTLSERGYVKMKGKGELLTYFLEEEDSSTRIRRLSDVKSSLLNKTQSGSILGPKLVAGDTGCDKNSNCSGYWSAEVPPTPTLDKNLTPCDSQTNIGLEYLAVNPLSRTSLWSTSHSENSNHVSGDHFNDSSSPTVLGHCMEDMLWNNVLYEDCEDTVNEDSTYSLVTMSEDVETSPEYIHLLDMFTSNTQDCIKDGATMEMV
ncbi:hypothetical protein ACJMK2_033832 [Sinanodonta woodiana]|uniref:Guanylate cyclase n=1 Tax=Sinanodonta woodiana TaxID=1069815 RepID=A0ABD3WRQ9_SINWO